MSACYVCTGLSQLCCWVSLQNDNVSAVSATDKSELVVIVWAANGTW
jgi:uncharacterized membrane protein